MREATKPQDKTRGRRTRALVVPGEISSTGIKRPTLDNKGEAPNSIGFSIDQTWGALKKCWFGYRVAIDPRKPDEEKAILYAKRIRKLQVELDIAVSEFPDLGLTGTEPGDVDLMCD